MINLKPYKSIYNEDTSLAKQFDDALDELYKSSTDKYALTASIIAISLASDSDIRDVRALVNDKDVRDFTKFDTVNLPKFKKWFTTYFKDLTRIEEDKFKADEIFKTLSKFSHIKEDLESVRIFDVRDLSKSELQKYVDSGYKLIQQIVDENER